MDALHDYPHFLSFLEESLNEWYAFSLYNGGLEAEILDLLSLIFLSVQSSRGEPVGVAGER
jgi:hypothetical protein